MMSGAVIWINGDFQLQQSFSCIESDKTVVVFGKITTDYDVAFKVNNLIMIGDFIMKNNLTIVVENGFFQAANIQCDGKMIVRGKLWHKGINDEAVEKIRALGIDIVRTPDDHLYIRIPS